MNSLVDVENADKVTPKNPTKNSQSDKGFYSDAQEQGLNIEAHFTSEFKCNLKRTLENFIPQSS